MDTSCLRHLLTEIERKQFSNNGYLIIENALTPEILDICLAAVDRIDDQIRKELNCEPYKRINVHDCIGKENDLLQPIILLCLTDVLVGIKTKIVVMEIWTQSVYQSTRCYR